MSDRRKDRSMEDSASCNWCRVVGREQDCSKGDFRRLTRPAALQVETSAMVF
jgi:hypothetical protein